MMELTYGNEMNTSESDFKLTTLSSFTVLVFIMSRTPTILTLVTYVRYSIKKSLPDVGVLESADFQKAFNKSDT